MYRPVIVAGRRKARAQPSSGREPAEAVIEDIEGKKGDPEDRHRHAEEAEHPQAPVDGVAPTYCGEHSER